MNTVFCVKASYKPKEIPSRLQHLNESTQENIKGIEANDLNLNPMETSLFCRDWKSPAGTGLESPHLKTHSPGVGRDYASCNREKQSLVISNYKTAPPNPDKISPVM